MRILGRIAGVFLSASATSMLIVGACVVAFMTSLLSPQTWRDTLDNQALVDELLPLTLPAVVDTTTASMLAGDADLPVSILDLNRALPSEAWRDLTSQLISDIWLEERLAQALNLFEGMSRGEAEVLQEPINLDAIRAQMTQIDASALAATILERVDGCTQPELSRLSTVAETGNGTIPICRPAEAEAYSFSQATIEETFSLLLEALPMGEVTVSEFYGITEANVEGFSLIVSTLNQLLLLLYLGPAALLSLVVMLAIRSQKGFGRWMGAVGLVVGFTLFLILVVLQLAALGSIGELVTTEPSADAFEARIGAALFSSLFSASSNTLFLQAVIATSVGFALLALSFLKREPMEDETYLITDDGEIISTASLRKTGAVDSFN